MRAEKLGFLRTEASVATLIKDNFRKTGQDTVALGLGLESLQDIPQMAVGRIFNASNDVVGFTEIQNSECKRVQLVCGHNSLTVS